MDLRLADIFSDRMVLQRDCPIPVWGSAAPGATVKVQFADQVKATTAGADGRWQVKLDPLPACSSPRDLVVAVSTSQQPMRKPGEVIQSLTIKDVLVGEVWLCSGQSNMQWSVSQSTNAKQEIAQADYPLIRLISVPVRTAQKPQASLGSANWQECAPATVAKFSAVGYFFGRELFSLLNVPIGLINSSLGGTLAEAWTSPEGLLAVPELREIWDSYERLGHDPAKMKAAYDQQMSVIETYTRDKGNAGWARGWAGLPGPNGDWPEMELPCIWQSVEDLNFSGVLWFRKELDLPPAWAGQDLRLAIGACDKSDLTYFNNTLVGSVTMQDRADAWSFLREYTVPGKLVRSGRNVIAVRVHSNMYAGGMTGPAPAMYLACPAQPNVPPIPLDGPWRYAVEQNYGLVHVPQPPQGPDSPHCPCCLFNAMIAPLAPFALRGVIWYQGESNVQRPRQYRTLFAALIRDWRRHWRQGDFPFLFVQLPNYQARCKEPSESQRAELREAQAMALALPNTGMAVAIDLGLAHDIHPPNKQDVGRRLAANALANVYKVPGVTGESPLFKKARPEESAIRIFFAQVGDGLVCRGDALQGFAVAGPDKKFVWAQARIEADTVLVWSSSVPKPAAVRYAWAENPLANLYNVAGLPAAPFRTDTWT